MVKRNVPARIQGARVMAIVKNVGAIITRQEKRPVVRKGKRLYKL
jgi:hypothetical protein